MREAMAKRDGQSVHRLLSGEARGVGAALLRGALCAVEPVYAAAMRARNALYGSGAFKVHRLDRPVISVGNITAGGTGKTPMVLWLAEQLIAGGRRPAVLMRGYKGRDGASDEQAVLAGALGSAAVVRADPDRVAGGRAVLSHDSLVDIFLLDDGFQHRRLHRDLDVVLIDATNPLGYGHVHPRGLLREPLRGLRRAGALVITRSNQASSDELSRLERVLRRHNPSAPIFHARHVHTGLRRGDEPPMPLEWLEGRRFFAVAGIANPRSLERQLRELPGELAGAIWFGDHHAYSADDLREMHDRARSAGVEALVVTEKDWVKLSRLAGASEGLPIVRLMLGIEFAPGEARSLMDLILSRLPVRA